MPNLARSSMKSRLAPAGRSHRRVHFFPSNSDIGKKKEERWSPCEQPTMISGGVHYPAGLLNKNPSPPVPRPLHKTRSAPVVQVGQETVRIRLRHPRCVHLIDASDSDEEEPVKDEQVTRSTVLPARSDTVTTTTEKQVNSTCLPPVQSAESCPTQMAVVKDVPFKHHRDYILDQVRKCRSVAQALMAIPAGQGSSSKGQRMFLARRHRATNAPWGTKCSMGTGGDEASPPEVEEYSTAAVAVLPKSGSNAIPGFRRTTFENRPKMSMAMASPKDCQKLSQCLNSDSPASERGVEMFLRQKQRAEKYTIDESKVRVPPRAPVNLPVAARMDRATPLHLNDLADCVKLAAERRQRYTDMQFKRSASVEPERFYSSLERYPNFGTSINRAYTPLPLTMSMTNGPFASKVNPTQPLYIQCYDRASMENSTSSVPNTATLRVSNFNSLPRGWSAYKAALKAAPYD